MDHMTKTVEKHSDNERKAMRKKQSRHDALFRIYEPEHDRTAALGYIRYPNDRPAPLQTLSIGSDMPIQRVEPVTQKAWEDLVKSKGLSGVNDENLYLTYENTFEKIDRTIQRIHTSDENEEIFDRIKTAFCTQENIHTIIGKMFSVITGASVAVGCYVIKEIIDSNTTENILNNLEKPISETLHDILYWTDHLKKEGVKTISLTDSDVHYRGIGVCIVTFSDDKKFVIKPGDKSFEQAVYGEQDDSIAAKFKNIMDERMKITKTVGQLNIMLSGEHGSAVEYFDHIDIHNMSNFKLDEAACKDIIEFASLLGLGDLHHENLVFNKATGIPQLIDAEVGFKYTMKPDDPLASSALLGDMTDMTLPNRNYENYYENPEYLRTLIEFLETTVLDKLKDLKCRRIVFATVDLYGWRCRVCENKKPFKPGEYINLLKNSSTCQNNGWTVNEKNAEEAQLKMCDDFKKGIIPFYEHDLNTGNIEQIFSDNTRIVILENKNKCLAEMIAENIKKLAESPCQRGAGKRTSGCCSIV